MSLGFSEEKRNPNSMYELPTQSASVYRLLIQLGRFWVCQVGRQEPEDLAIMDFNVHCSEQVSVSLLSTLISSTNVFIQKRVTWVAACIYTVAHGLIIPTILLGFISCNGPRKRPTFKDAIIRREDSGKDSVFQRLKGKFTRK